MLKDVKLQMSPCKSKVLLTCDLASYTAMQV